MNFTKIITTLTLKQLLRDLLDQELPNEYRKACRNEYFSRRQQTFSKSENR
tara:strand:+ start:725 stop:877 length:153 start_codon:yes stop_codon:yes gene_type:complete